MKTFTECGGPAFPSSVDHADGSSVVYAGLTLRDYFAAKALQGLLAALDGYRPSHLIDADAFADEAYGLADAMLAERVR